MRTYDLGVANGQHFLTMELLAGTSLRERMSGPLDVRTTLSILRQIAAGLTAAHEAGVVHRDLKPTNVLLALDGRVAVTDFGIARGVSDEPSELTRSGLLLGTPAYMAPEQLAGGVAGPAADLYAFGLIAYEMVTGARVHAPESLPRARLMGAPVDAAPLQHLPPALASVVLSCLASEVGDRPSGAREVYARLATPEAEHALLAFGPTLPHVTPPFEEPTLQEPEEAAMPRFSPLPGTRHRLAVLPFHASDASDTALAVALSEELTDRLCRTDGMLVFGTGATQSLAHRSVREVGEELGVDMVVDGTFVRSGARARTSIRLSNAATGAQVWAEHFDGEMGDVLELQDRIAIRIAELLRVELELRAPDVRLHARDVVDYLAARSRLLGPLGEVNALREAVTIFRTLLERSPHFELANAGFADALVRLSFAGNREVDPSEVDRAVEHALRIAPWLPETQLAAGRREVARGNFAGAAAALGRATRMAPTFAGAQAYLGSLQVEAGRAEEGRDRIELAVRIDPKESWALIALAKHFGLRRDYARSEALLTSFHSPDPRHELSCLWVRLRRAVWRDSREDAAALESEVLRLGPEGGVLRTFFRAWTGAEPSEALVSLLAHLAPHATPRARSLHLQLLVEVCVRTGRRSEALRWLEEAGATALIDLDWLSYCEALEPLRQQISKELVEAVERRAAQIWRV